MNVVSHHADFRARTSERQRTSDLRDWYQNSGKRKDDGPNQTLPHEMTPLLFSTRGVRGLRRLKADCAVRAVAEWFVRGSAAAAERDDWLRKIDLVAICVEEIKVSFDKVWAVPGRTDGYLCHVFLLEHF